MGNTGKRNALRTGYAAARRGYTLVELAVAVMVFTVSIGAVSTTLMTTVALSRSSQETSVALDAAQSVLAAMQADDFENVFANYSALPGATPGRYFDVPGLSPTPGDLDGFVGEISFPGDGLTLREDVLDEELGMRTGPDAGRDLNGDGAIDALDHALDYTILPVRVRLEWRGGAGDQTLDLVSVISVR